MRAILLVLTVLTPTLLTVKPAMAALESLTVQVDGLVCPFCVYGLEKQLKKLSTVEQVTIVIDDGFATLKLTDTARLVDDENPDGGLVAVVIDAVESAGFTPRRLAVVAVGRVEAEGDTVELVVSSTSERVAVHGETRDELPQGLVRAHAAVRDTKDGLVLDVEELTEHTDTEEGDHR